MDPKQRYLETVVQLDTDHTLDQLILFIQTTPANPNELLEILTHLLTQSRVRVSYLLAMLLANQGHHRPTIDIALCLGGLIYHNPHEYARGATSLENHVGLLPPQQQFSFYLDIILPALIALLEYPMADTNATAAFSKKLAALVPAVWQLVGAAEGIAALSPTELAHPAATASRLTQTRAFLQALGEHDDCTPAFLHFIQQAHQPNDLLVGLAQRLMGQKLCPAYVCAMLLANGGNRHLLVAFALSLGGLVHNNPIEEERGLVDLPALADHLPEELHDFFYSHVASPLLSTQMDLNDPERIMRLLRILTAAIPNLRTIFDLHATAPDLTPERLQQQVRTATPLLSHPLPAAWPARSKRRALVAMRLTVMLTPSDLSNLGPRYAACLNDYGWQAEFLPLTLTNTVQEYAALAARCLEEQVDVLFLDFDMIIHQSGDPAATRMIRHTLTTLKQQRPDLKMVGCLWDVWMFSPWIKGYADLFDLILTGDTPSLPLWQDPEVAGKIMQCVTPVGIPVPAPVTPLVPRMLFVGGLLSCWLRPFWLIAAEQIHLPVARKIWTHYPDGLPALDSYAIYIQNLQNATCCINFSMRSNQARIITHRCFEILLSGALLIQELTPDLDLFLTAGVHYLEFTTMADLAAIVRFITNHPEEAEKIRQQGYAFACERYSNIKLTGYIDQALFG
ncbi:MAG: glycosyltransferase family 1 protein [Magnetococcales bacterium]|nr:glycosyltransferase family 1 protein [Magnetococcales bacterium]NGZ05314.1 glycosyltransferase family 1 protein [Magnetococcales bacterium]